MSRVATFIDGAYLEKLLNPAQFARINFALLAERLAGGKEIMRTYYYDAPPYLGKNPNERDTERFNRKQRFFSKLLSFPRVAVRQGKTVFRGGNDGKRVFQQKKVDGYFNVDLAVLAAKGSITSAILVAGDSDMVPSVEAAKAEGVVVHLVHGMAADVELIQLCDERTLITDELINSAIPLQ